jgi:hypothetical protein
MFSLPSAFLRELGGKNLDREKAVTLVECEDKPPGTI